MLDEDNEIQGFSADQAERIMEYVAQARDGFITKNEMATKIELVVGAKFETQIG